MDKNAIKKYAVWARRELISRVSQKALQYGITEKDIVPADAESVNGHLLTAAEKKQRQALVAQVNEKGYEQVMEEVAYTWFNRFSALRFMEVNGYLPSHVRIFTDDENNFKPQILSEAIHLELDGLDMNKVYAFKEANQTEELYKYLLITQCNDLNAILPGMFQKIEDYTELLFPDNLLREGSVVEQMIALILEDDWKDAVQIIGWLYQYYNTEPKDKVFADLKKNIKITKDNIPAATQLFTPDWIVRYMVENSLGRLWLERDKAESGLSDEYMNASYYGWKYYLEEAEQEPEVQRQLATIREEYKSLKPEDIRCIDPCMGSGHILVYMFDVLIQIYEAYGYTTHEAVASIIKNNIYGLDIDDRAAQLANFAVMMKARQYDRRFFSRVIQPRVYAITESNHVSSYCVDYFCDGNVSLKSAIDTIMQEMHDAKEYGSIISISKQNFAALYARFGEIQEDVNMLRNETLSELLPVVQVAEILAQKYDVVITNPPYMGASGMSVKLDSFVKQYYADSKYDLFAVFIEKCRAMLRPHGYQAMITQQSFMFINSFEKLRNKMTETSMFSSMMFFGFGAFGADFGTTSFVLMNNTNKKYNAVYINLSSRRQLEDKEKYCAELLVGEENADIHRVSITKMSLIPGMPFAFWLSDRVLDAFSACKLKTISDARIGLVPGNNAHYLRLWFEVNNNNIGFCMTRDVAVDSGLRWFPYNKGGAYCKWYGNREYVVDWFNDGHEMQTKLHPDGKRIWAHNFNLDYIFNAHIGWTDLTSGRLSFRYYEDGFLFDSSSDAAFMSDDHIHYVLGYLNTHFVSDLTKVINPTIHFKPGDYYKLPFSLPTEDVVEVVSYRVKENTKLCKDEFDSFETSWDFQTHPLISGEKTIATAFDKWQAEAETCFTTLKANEEELNRIFIDIYGLQDELTPEVEDKDVTIRKADLVRDVKSFISYAVGCMFGRYSLDVNGLVFAGGEWDDSKYSSFPVDMDNIIPICDDEYFEDDIAGRFVKFVEIVYGKETLQENLKFIADALGGKGQLKEVIRNYFINDFYKDHCKIYQKRPIYWLFDSGKKNGFKALIYMHRYQPDTIARMRTDYVHEQQARYRTAITDLEQRNNGASTSERVKLNKQLIKLQEQASEIQAYEEKIHHLADQMIPIELDDGVKHNYEIFIDVLAKIK